MPAIVTARRGSYNSDTLTKHKPDRRATVNRRINGTPARVEDAQAIAVEALAFLATDDERLGRFLALTGLSPDTIRAAAASPGFLVAVLDHLAEDESMLVAFSANAGRDPAAVAKARAVLAGPIADGMREG